MRDLEAPPLSAPIADFRAEVGRRASGLRRGRRLATGGAIGALVLAGGLTAVSLTATSDGGNRSAASSTVPAVPSTTRPGDDATASPYGPAGGGLSGRSTASGAQPALAAPTPSAGPPWSQAGTVTLSHPPSGSTFRVAVHTPITVALAAPSTGSWGSARIEQGQSSVLALGGQAGDARGGVEVYLKALSPGVVVLEVPGNGNSTATWHATLVVIRSSSHR